MNRPHLLLTPTKPFDFQELLARVRALLRRGPALKEETLRFADLVVDTRRRSAFRDGRSIKLTSKESPCWITWRGARARW